jgi:hypothetical protein
MFLRTLCKRGPSGPAFFAATLGVMACAAADVKVDLARAVPMDEYASKLQSLRRCEAGSLEIAYSFGEIALTAERAGAGCRLRVALLGELQSKARPARFLCDIGTIEAIDWIKDQSGTRENPPLRELQARSSCLPSTEE